MIIAIDFDGTIVHDQYPHIGAVKPNAGEIIRKLKADGHYIIIWTCRAGNYAHQVFDFLREKEIPFDRINESNPDNVQKYGGMDTRKVYADVYIDDKAINGLPHWEEIYQLINKKLNGSN